MYWKVKISEGSLGRICELSNEKTAQCLPFLSHGPWQLCCFLNDTEVMCQEFIPKAGITHSYGHKDILAQH